MMLYTVSFKSFIRNSRPGKFCKKGVLRNFAKFMLKHPCQNLFFDKLVGLSLQLYYKRDSGRGAFLRIL